MNQEIRNLKAGTESRVEYIESEKVDIHRVTSCYHRPDLTDWRNPNGYDSLLVQ